MAGFAEPGSKQVRLWQPSLGTTNIAFPARLELPARQVTVLTEEDALDHLGAVARLTAPARNDRVVFELASAEDLEGWTLTGNAFSISPIAGLVPKPSLNSLTAAGEAATGTALSPTFNVEGPFEEMELVIQGGWSQESDGRQDLAIRLLEAGSGKVLEEILPPGKHEWTKRRIKLDKLKGKSIRIQLVDDNTGSSFAWIGLRRVVLLDPSAPTNEK